MPTENVSAAPKPILVLVAEKLGGAGLKMLKEAPGVELRDMAGAPRADLLAAIPAATALLVRSGTKVDRELIEAGKNLRVIGRAGVGVDNVDVPVATERGILVVNSPSGNTLAAVEQTFAILFALLRKVPDAVASFRKGEWKRTQFTGTELHGKTVGVVGLGRIGSGVADRAKAFGCTIVGYDPFLPPARAAELGYRMAPLAEVIASADILTLHLPVEPGARPMIGAEELATMKKSAVIVNCARGGLIDEEALADALANGRLAGAAIDVWATEPPPADHPLLKLANVVPTPHLGASTAEAQERVAVQTVETLLAVLAGSFAVPAVNLPFGPGGPELAPLLEIGRVLGALAAGILGGPIEEVGVEVDGLPERSLKAASCAALAGALGTTFGDEINVISAAHLAAGRGIRVSESHHATSKGYPNRVAVRVAGGGRSAQAEGTLFFDRHPRITGIDGFRIEFEPKGWVLHIVNRNVPGVVGRIGTILGEAKVNIADMALARHPAGDKALALISTESAPNDATLQQLGGLPEIDSVRLIRL